MHQSSSRLRPTELNRNHPPSIAPIRALYVSADTRWRWLVIDPELGSELRATMQGLRLGFLAFLALLMGPPTVRCATTRTKESSVFSFAGDLTAAEKVAARRSLKVVKYRRSQAQRDFTRPRSSRRVAIARLGGLRSHAPPSVLLSGDLATSYLAASSLRTSARFSPSCFNQVLQSSSLSIHHTSRNPGVVRHLARSSLTFSEGEPHHVS